MNKLAKRFLLALAGLTAVLLLAILSINLYVESESVQARLESAVSREIRMPVKLSRVRFSFWSGLKVDGVTIPGGEEPFLHAPMLSAKLEWSPLFSRRLVVTEVLISSPKVVWTQTRKGKWRLPEIEKEKRNPKERAETSPEPKPSKIATVDTADTSNTTETQEPPASAPVTVVEAEKKKEVSESKGKVEFRVTFSRIENAAFHFLDRNGEPVAVFEGVTVNIPTAGKGEVHGDATVRKLTLHNSIVIEEITTPFVFEDGKLSLPEVAARLAGGTIKGDYSMEPEEEGSPFDLHVKFADVDLNRMVAESGSTELQKIEGKLEGSLQLQGKSSQKKSIVGEGGAKLSGGKMEQYPVLQMLGQTLAIEELTRLEMQRAELNVRIANARVYVEKLALESLNLNLDATGEVRFDGKLDLDAGLAINQKIYRQIPKWFQSHFKTNEESDLRRLPFSIGGTLQRPDTDLARVILGEKIERQAGDLLRALRLTGDKKKKKDSGEKKSKKQGANPDNHGEMELEH